MQYGCFAAEEDGKELKAYLYVHADVPLDLIALVQAFFQALRTV